MSEVREHPFYFGKPAQRLFGVLHQPPDAAGRKDAAWLFCSAFAEERNQSHRHMLEWARVLCREGFWVLRFDYRGYGDSDGLFEQFTIDDYLTDVRTAMAELERRAGVPCRGLCGLRLGATLAALAAAELPDAPMRILWEPVINGADYIDELLRLVMAKQMKESGAAPKTRDQLKQDILDGREVDVFGHVITEPIYKSLLDIDLAAAPPYTQGPVRIVRLSTRPAGKIPAPFHALCEACGQGGNASVDFAHVRPLPWQHAAREYDVRPEALFDPTREWVRASFVRQPAPPGGTAPWRDDASPRQNGVERVVGFPVEGVQTWGILHVPKDHDPAKPAVVMLSVAENCRSTDARFYVKLARLLGRHGYASLRADPRGIGDSEGRLEGATLTELYLRFQNGHFLPEARSAIAFLEREIGAASFVLTGICAGAITSIYQAAANARVTAVAPLELTMFYEVEPGLAEVSAKSRRLVQNLFIRWQPALTQEPTRRCLSWLRRQYGKALCTLKGAEDVRPFVERLGPEANTKMLTALMQCARRHVPILLVFSAEESRQVFARIEPQVLRAYDKAADRIERHVVREADHIFSKPAHAQEVFSSVVDWLERIEKPRSATSNRSSDGECGFREASQ